MQRKMVLVDFYWTRDKDPRVPLGHASLLAALASVPNCEVVSIVEPVNLTALTPEMIVSTLLRHADGWPAERVDIALGAYVWGETLVRATLAGLRRAGFAGRIILGGPQVSYAGAGLEQLYPEVDVFVRGYGEAALCELAREGGRPRVKGVHYAGTADLLEQASVDLETLPSPWLEGVIPLEGQRFVRWETQRGCPYKCGFCQHREAGARLRRRSLELGRVRSEVDGFCLAGVDDIAVLDPIFNDGPYAIEVLERFHEQGFTGRLSLQCRAETLTTALLDVAARLNVRLELGLQTIHRSEARAVTRNNNLPLVERALSEVRKRGIDHEVSIIFGLPCQTIRSFTETVAWCLEQSVPVIKAFPLLLLRGTPLERDAAQWGLEVSGGTMPMVVRSSTFTRPEWRRMAQLSEALKLTERRHPRDVRELVASADAVGISMERWVPAEV